MYVVIAATGVGKTAYRSSSEKNLRNLQNVKIREKEELQRKPK